MCGCACGMYNILWVWVCMCVHMHVVLQHTCLPRGAQLSSWFPASQMRWGPCSGPALPPKGKSVKSDSRAVMGDWSVLLSWLLGTVLLPRPSLHCPPCGLGAPAGMLQFYPMRRSPVCKRPQARRPARPAGQPASREPRVLAMFQLNKY